MSVSAAEVATWATNWLRQRIAGEHQHVAPALDAEIVVRAADLRAARAGDERDRPARVMGPLIRWLVGRHCGGSQPPVAEPAVSAAAAGEMEDRGRRAGGRAGLRGAPFPGPHDEDPHPCGGGLRGG